MIFALTCDLEMMQSSLASKQIMQEDYHIVAMCINVALHNLPKGSQVSEGTSVLKGADSGYM